MPRADGGDGGDGGHGAQPAAEIAASPSDGAAAPVSAGGAEREVVAWLSTVGLERYAPQLIEAGYDRLVFLEGMDDAEADEAAATCGMLRPHVRAFKTAAQELHRAAAGAPTPAAAATAPAGVSVSVEVQPAPTPAPVLHAAPLVVAAGAGSGTTVVLGESVEAVAAVPTAAASSSGQLQPQAGSAWQRAKAAAASSAAAAQQEPEPQPQPLPPPTIPPRFVAAAAAPAALPAAPTDEDKAAAQAAKLAANDKLRARDLPGALAAYSDAINFDPTCAIFFANRAAVYTKLTGKENLEKAVADCLEASGNSGFPPEFRQREKHSTVKNREGEEG